MDTEILRLEEEKAEIQKRQAALFSGEVEVKKGHELSLETINLFVDQGGFRGLKLHRTSVEADIIPFDLAASPE